MPQSGSILSDWNLQFGQDKIKFPSYKFILKSNFHQKLSYKVLYHPTEPLVSMSDSLMTNASL